MQVDAPVKTLPDEILELVKNELNVHEIKWTKKGKEIKVIYDTEITPDLAEEAKARELLRSIQSKRKEQGFSLGSTAVVYSPWLPKSKQIIKWLTKRALVSHFKKGSKLKVVKG